MSTIGRRVAAEYTAKKGNHFPQLGQAARGVTPSFATGSGCIAQWATTTLTFSAASLASGLTTLTATGFLTSPTNTPSVPNAPSNFGKVNIDTANFDLGQPHFSVGAFTTPTGMMVGHPSFQMQSTSAKLTTANTLQKGTTYNSLSVLGTVVVYAPTSIATSIKFSIPLTVAFLGDVQAT